MEYPATATPASSSKAHRMGKIATWVISILLIFLVAMIFIGQKIMMGTRYKVSDKESVNYSGKATEADARVLGEALKDEGYFNSEHKVDVLLKKDDQEGTIVSFVGDWNWKDEKIVSGFRKIGEDIAAKGLGQPLTVRLLDTQLNTKNEIKVP